MIEIFEYQDLELGNIKIWSSNFVMMENLSWLDEEYKIYQKFGFKYL